MKNITLQSDPRQNNCRNTTSPAITPPTREWTTGPGRGTLTICIVVVVLFDWGRHKQNPDRGFPFLRSALPYQSLRFASAMMTTSTPATVQITSVFSDQLQGQHGTRGTRWKRDSARDMSPEN